MKTKHIILGLIVTILSITFISSCKKYEDGPAFSLRSKKARLSGDWKLESFAINGDEASNFYTSYELIIEKDGTYTNKSTINLGILSVPKEVSGTWKFGEDKDDVYLTPSGGSEVSYRITRLKNKELWMYATESNGTKYSYKLKQ